MNGPILEKNHSSARNAIKTSVAETSQQWCFYMFLTKNGVAGVGSFGGTPPTPPGRGWELLLGVNFLMDPYWRKSHTIATDATKSYVNETSQNWRFFYRC